MSTNVARGGLEANRLALVIALILTVAAIGAGTWILGSGGDPAQPGSAPVVAEVSVPESAEPPVPVAPPPAKSR